MFSTTRAKMAAGAVLLALVILPAPLLPPQALAGAVQSMLGVGWKAAYLVSAIGLQVALYSSLGVVASFAVGVGMEQRRRWLQLAVVPAMVVGIAVVIRSLKLGHVPMLANAWVPMAACALGVLIGLLFRQHGWRVTVVAMVVLAGGLLWAFFPGVSSDLRRATEAQVRRLVAAGPGLPSGDQRFGKLLQAAFAPLPDGSAGTSDVEHNRAAILALGIALGHEKLARYAGLERDSELVRAAAALRTGATLRGREDWVRHFSLSAALAVVENPFLSDAGGLIKEQLDALTHGSGFSFGDLAADRAGIRFAQAATGSSAEAQVMQTRLAGGFSVDDFFPPAADLPENLTTEQFRRDYGGVGSSRYRQTSAEIDARLNRCAALSGR